MGWRNVVELSKKVYWVGVRDWNRRLFDALIPLPKGTTYNSYLVIGSDKKALIDTVNPGFEKELEDKISTIVEPTEIDYLIMNHAEPDHAGAIPYIMSINDEVRIVATSKGAKMAERFYGVQEKRIITVSDHDTIDLGGKTLYFIEAPMLHWPETMFTYLKEDDILFSCDFFGSHVAKGLYDDELEDLLIYAQTYFGEIMMPFRSMARRALEKIKDLEIKMIAPSHGPIYRFPQRILEAYKKWVDGITKEKVIIVYVSMWGSTEKMIQVLAETLSSEGVETSLYNLVSADIGEIARDLVDSRGIVLGTPTVLGGMHPLAIYITYLLRILRPPIKYGVMLTSYGWGGGAVKQALELLSPLKIEMLGMVKILGPPTREDVEKIIELGKQLSKKIKE